MKRLVLLDDDGDPTGAGDTVEFRYGIPPVRVLAPVIERDGRLVALTPGHTPIECKLRSLRYFAGSWYKQNAQISGGTPYAESDCSTEYPHYHADCPKCGKRTSWLDPREYGDTIGCLHCGYEIELSNTVLSVDGEQKGLR